MTLHYHGTPITPLTVLETLAGRCFCISYANPEQIERCHQIGQSVMLDNGAFSFWKSGIPTNWEDYYKWIEPWLDCPTTWAVIPDIISGTEEENRALVKSCPYPNHKMAPVWHLHESLDYLEYLVVNFQKVCFGSSSKYSEVGSLLWHDRVKEAFERVGKYNSWIHMLRGMKTCDYGIYPFASVDSANIARNHHASKNGLNKAKSMADILDSKQCPIRYAPVPRLVRPKIFT